MEGHRNTGADQPAVSFAGTPLASLTVEQFARALAIHAALVTPKGAEGGDLDQAVRDTRRILAFIEHGTREGVLLARTPRRFQQVNEEGGSYASSSGAGAG